MKRDNKGRFISDKAVTVQEIEVPEYFKQACHRLTQQLSQEYFKGCALTMQADYKGSLIVKFQLDK